MGRQNHSTDGGTAFYIGIERSYSCISRETRARAARRRRGSGTDIRIFRVPHCPLGREVVPKIGQLPMQLARPLAGELFSTPRPPSSASGMHIILLRNESRALILPVGKALFERQSGDRLGKRRAQPMAHGRRAVAMRRCRACICRHCSGRCCRRGFVRWIPSVCSRRSQGTATAPPVPRISMVGASPANPRGQAKARLTSHQSIIGRISASAAYHMEPHPLWFDVRVFVGNRANTGHPFQRS